MRSINETILEQLKANELRPFYLLDMEIDSTHYRFTDCDVPINFDGELYEPRSLTFDPITYSAGTIVNRARVTLDNLDSFFTALFVGSTVQGSSVTLKLVVMDNEWHVIGQPWGLVAGYDFNEGEGTVLHDRTGHGNNGTIYGASWADGVSGKALSFDGEDDYVRVPRSSSLEPSQLTVAVWVKMNSLTSTSTGWGPMLVSKYGGNYKGYTLCLAGETGKPSFRISEPSTIYAATSPEAIPTNEWCFIAGTWDGSKVRIYVDGVLKNTANAPAIVHDPDKDLYIGRDSWANLDHVDGLIDEVRIYNRALLPEEISYLYNNPGQDMTPGNVTLFEGIIDSWRLDETQVSIDITSILNRWAHKTVSLHPSSCRWKKFKGPECGYTGPEIWCDRSYARCAALGNTANFGGNRWLPKIVDKEIWWGKTRK